MSNTVNRITLPSRSITLVGTAHISRDSVAEVESIIAEEQPGRVCVEIDQTRYQSMTQGSRWENLDIGKVLKEGKGFFLLANLAASRTGRRWRAGRDDGVAAELAGINVGRDRVIAFVVSTGCAGLAGGVMALVVRLTAPAGFGLTLSLALLAGVVIGGLGSLTGALVGAAILTFLPQLTTNAGLGLGLSALQAAELATLAYGLTLMIVILLAPRGIVGSIRARLRAGRERRAAAR